MSAKKVLLVDADAFPRRALTEQLDGLGYQVVATESADRAFELADACDLLLIGGAGVADADALVRFWRETHGTAPLVLVEDAARRDSLEAEGAAALTKPVRLAELARKLTELGPVAGAPPFEIGDLSFHPATRELRCGRDKPVRLTEREAAILSYLHRNADRSVPRDELLAQVLGYADETATHTLETHIYRLRRKLASTAEQAPRLVSEAKGYRLAVA